MILVLSTLLLILFTSLGLIHFYWLFGGKWGLKQAVPTKSKGEKAMDPPKVATALVGIGLMLFGGLYLIKSGLLSIQIPNWLTLYGGWIIPSLFLVRAIGDFNYIGLFKKVKDTEFAKADSKLFVPLCLLIGVLGLLIQLKS